MSFPTHTLKILAALRSKMRIYCFGIKLLVEGEIRAFCNNDNHDVIWCNMNKLVIKYPDMNTIEVS